MASQSDIARQIRQLEENICQAQATVADLKKANDNGADEDDDNSRSARDAAPRPRPRPRVRRRASFGSDDDVYFSRYERRLLDSCLEYARTGDECMLTNGSAPNVKTERPGTENAEIEKLERANAAARAAQAGQKRKRAAAVRLDVSGLAASLPEVDGVRGEEPERLVAILPVCLDAVYSEDEEASRPTKKTKKEAPPAPKFKPTPQRPLPTPLWTRPTSPPVSPASRANTFRLPDANLMSRFQVIKAGAKQTPTSQRKSTASEPSPGHQSASQKDKSANVPHPSPAHKGDKKKSRSAVSSFFPFKFIVRYNNAPKTSLDFHNSIDLQDDISDFWHRLSELILTWESRAGAFWEWELAKPSRKKCLRVCVSSALAKKRTKWRVGDDGFFAFQDCASRALPCFTWVRNNDEQEGEQDAEAKGEFWCLPVHEELGIYLRL